MRILIISTFFPPLNSIASLRPHSWAKYWTELGHDVTILTTKKQEGTLHDFNIEEVEMPSIARSLKKPGQTPGRTGLLQKILHHLRFKKGILNACRMPDLTDLWIAPAWKRIKKKGTWDLVVSTAGPYSTHVIADRLKRKGLAKKWIADYRDTWSNNYIYPGLFPFNVIEKFLEKKLIRSADIITTVSTPFAESLSKLFKRDEVFTIENGFDPSDLQELDPAPVFANNKTFRIVHTGSIYVGKRDPTPLFEAISEMRDDPLLNSLEVVFVGDRQANVEELIEKYCLSQWVKMVGMVDRKTALRMQRDAHALLFLPWNDPTVDGVLTGKIFEYLYSGTPIIAVGGKGMEASQRLVEEANAGTILHDVQEIKQFLTKNLSKVEKEKNAVENTVLKRYDRKHLALKLLSLVEKSTT